MSPKVPGPRRELAQLAASLAAELRRRESRGLRKVPAASRALVAGGTAADAVSAGGQRDRVRPAAPGPAAARAAGAAGSSPRPTRSGAVQPLAPERVAALEKLRAEVAACRACELCHSRTQTVFSDGSGAARVLFVGEAPGYYEDQKGVPFVGRAGEILTSVIEKGMGLSRAEVAIANVLKCRPPDNRDPTAEEKERCTPFLDRQIELLDPLVIVPLGRHAACHVLRTDAPMGRLRGRVHEVAGRKVVPTYHPAYLLRNPGAKRECWKDIQLAMAELGLSPGAPAPRS